MGILFAFTIRVGSTGLFWTEAYRLNGSTIDVVGRVKMVDITELHRALVARVLGDGGHAPSALRRAAFDNADLPEPLRTLTEKVAYHADRVTDDDVAAARIAGLTEDQIFEIVVCAAVGQASRQYENALAALVAATRGGQ